MSSVWRDSPYSPLLNYGNSPLNAFNIKMNSNWVADVNTRAKLIDLLED